MSNLPSSLVQVAPVPRARGAASQSLERLLNLVFPPRCVACGKPGSGVCAACLACVQGVPQPVCRRCGRPVVTALRCELCGERNFFVSAIRAAGVYTHPLSQAVRQFKYSARTDLRFPLGVLLAGYWRAREVSTDLVAAVPLHEQRLRERGFNQSQLLATELCRAMQLPLLSPGILVRHRYTRQQVLLGLAERRHNVHGAFSWEGPPLGGIKVLLIDDVATTGSTLEACGETLLRAGAGKVWALTVARAYDRHAKTAQPSHRGAGPS